MRTQGAFFADTPHNGGVIVVPAHELGRFSANLVLTRNAIGDYSLNRTAGGAETYQIVASLAQLLRKVTTYPGVNGMPFQEAFGTATGNGSNPGYPAGAAGLPPFAGDDQLTAPTTMTPKGIKVTDVFAVYQAGVVDLTAASLSLNRTVYVNGVAPAVTNIPISATALTLTAAATPYLATRAVTTPAFEVTDNSDLELEFAVTLANTGTFRMYALGFHCQYNFN